MTWGEFAWRVEGHHLNELEHWKRTRMLLMQQYNMHTKHPIKDPEQFMPLEPKPKKPFKWKKMPLYKMKLPNG